MAAEMIAGRAPVLLNHAPPEPTAYTAPLRRIPAFELRGYRRVSS